MRLARLEGEPQRLAGSEQVALADAHCLGVVYPPVDEDYGYVTLEAMLSSKPVLTCADSGGPLEFVLEKEAVTEPTGASVGEAVKSVLDDPRAVAMAQVYLSKNADRLASIVPAGEAVTLVELGTHCRGAIFADGLGLRRCDGPS